jgi:hypothetical protein
VSGEKGREGATEENFALLSKGKGKGKKGSKIDIIKVHFFACNEYGHYAAQCPNRKGTKEKEKEKQVATSAEVNEFSEKFEKEFSLVSIISSGNSNNFEFDRTWMVDSGATSHMTGMLDSFLFISEIGPGHVVNGTCYPRYLGITRRSCLEAHMVLDMEYREQELPEHGPGGPFFSFSARFVLPAVPASITTGLGLYQRGLLLHEVIGPRYHGMCHI